MNGTLKFTGAGWEVEYVARESKSGRWIVDRLSIYQETFNQTIKQPIIPLVDGMQVEFEIEDFWETGGDEGIKLAKLIIPKEEPKINLEEIPQEQLEKERNSNYEYFSIEEEDTKESSIFDFVCEDPNCPHCEEDRRQMEDDEYPELDGTNELCNDKIWDDIYHDYTAEQYPAFGGPFTDSISFIDWLKKNYKSPEKK
jgi:hypothetical protein